MKNSILKVFNLLFTAIIFFSIWAFSANAQTAQDPCARMYLNAFGKCSVDCTSIGNDFSVAPNNPCEGGLICCQKTAGASATDQSQLQLQIPLFNNVSVNNLANYIALVYQYAMIVIIPLAIIMIIVGGIMWILAAGNKGNIDKAKSYMVSAFSGLIIALTSYVLLSLVGITQLKMPAVTYIQPVDTIDLEVNIPLEPSGDVTAPAGFNPGDANPAGCPKDSDLQDIDQSKVAFTGQLKNSLPKLRPVTLAKLYAAQDAAKKQGCTLSIQSAFRTYDMQAYFYNCFKTCSCNGCHAAAAPQRDCSSPHMTGGAADMAISGSGCNLAKLKSIMFSIGWTKWSGETWHFEYGTKHWSTNAGKEY